MTAAPNDEHLPMSDGATALAPQAGAAPAPAPAPRRARPAPARPARPRRAAPRPAAAEPTRQPARSAAAAPATEPATRPAPRPRPRPAPRVTPAPGPSALARARAKAARTPRAPRAPFVILLLVLMGSGLVCLLLLNTALSENAFKEHALQTTSSTLADQEEALAVQSDRLSAPGALAGRAQGLGMQPGGLPKYLPSGTPLPPGARVVAGSADENGGVTLYVVPAPGQPAAAAPAAGQPASGPAAGQPAGQPSGQPSQPAGQTGQGATGQETDAGAGTSGR